MPKMFPNLHPLCCLGNIGFWGLGNFNIALQEHLV